MALYDEKGMNGAPTPGCIIAVVDQSGSMATIPNGASKSKAQFAVESISEVFKELAMCCVKNDKATDRVFLGAIGYSDEVRSLWEDSPEIKLRAMTEVYPFIQKCDDDNCDLFKVVNDSVTRMDLAFNAVNQLLDEHAKRCLQSPCCGKFPPPVIFHITDGIPTDSLGHGLATKSIKTDGSECVIADVPDCIQRRIVENDEGPINIFNIYLSDDWNAAPIVFPESGDARIENDPLSFGLFKASTALSAHQVEIAKNYFDERKASLSEKCRCLAVRADAKSLVRIMTWGSIVMNRQPDGASI